MQMAGKIAKDKNECAMCESQTDSFHSPSSIDRMTYGMQHSEMGEKWPLELGVVSIYSSDKATWLII